MGCMDKKERGRGGKSRNEGRTRDRTGEWPRNTLNDGKRSESPVGPSLAKAAVGQEWQSQTKPTTEPGPFFPSPTPPRQFKSIFFSLFIPPFLSSLSPYFLSPPDDRLLPLLPHRRPVPKHQRRLPAKWFKSLPPKHYARHHSHHPQETHGIRRVRQPSQPGPP
jgi:hypothetical protein